MTDDSLNDTNDVAARVEARQRAESVVRERLLALVFSKPLETFTTIPKGWKCTHVDYATQDLWPDLERELMPMLNSLISSLAYRNRVPTDVCVVRAPGRFCIVVQYAE